MLGVGRCGVLFSEVSVFVISVADYWGWGFGSGFVHLFLFDFVLTNIYFCHAI